MYAKKSILILLVVLASILLAGFGLVGDVTSAVAAPAIQPVDEDQMDESEEEQTDDTETEEAQTLWDVIQAMPQLEDFETLLQAAGLADNLEADGPFTVFAPTDAAMAAFEAVAASSKATATEILLYHLANGQYNSQDLSDHSTLPTLLGEHIAITVRGGEIVLNDMDNPITLTTTDVEAENGIIHVVDAVLVPPVNSLITTDSGSREHTLDEVLTADGRFTTFLSLMETANLETDLANLAGSYTVFAPTDQAFEKLSDEQFNQLLTNPEMLDTILAYHLVGDMLEINQIATDDYIPTIEGRPLIVSTDESMHVFLNGQPLADFNIIAANGVIHAVDAVLMP